MPIIPKAYAELPQEVIDAEVQKIQNKCKVQAKLIDVQYGKKDQCFQAIDLILQNGNNYYKFTSSYLYEACTFDGYYQVYLDIPKGKMQYIVSDSDFRVISNNLQTYAQYDDKPCEVNYSQQKYISEYGSLWENSSYFFHQHWLGSLIVFLLIGGASLLSIYKIKSRN